MLTGRATAAVGGAMKFRQFLGGADPGTPVPGLAAVAAELAWRGPLTNPDLIPEVDYDLFQPAAYPEPDPAIILGSLMLQLHAAFPRKGRRGYLVWQAVDSTHPVQPSLSRLQPPMLVQCYRSATADRQLTIGTCRYWLARHDYGGIPRGSPAAASVEVSSGFCAVRLSSPCPAPVEVFPCRSGMSPDAIRTGDPRLDAHYGVSGLPLPVPGQLADLIMSRTDWAFGGERHTLACVTLHPLRSGADARDLALSSARVADLLGC